MLHTATIGLKSSVRLRGLLAGDDRIVEHPDAVRASLDDYKAGRVGFTDALIDQINRARGCEATATFDRRAAKLDGLHPSGLTIAGKKPS